MKTMIWKSQAVAEQPVAGEKPMVDDVHRQANESDALRIVEEWTRQERARSAKEPAPPAEWNLSTTSHRQTGSYVRP
jgi:hypothetical protein